MPAKKQTAPEGLLACPQCHRVGGHEVTGTCGSPLTCAKRMVPVDAAKEVVIGCEHCDKIRAVPVSLIMSGKVVNLDMNCQLDRESCKARVVASHATSEG